MTYIAGTPLPSVGCVDPGISTFEDNILEGDHEFTATITETSADPTTIITISAPSTQTVVIQDDESKFCINLIA